MNVDGGGFMLAGSIGSSQELNNITAKVVRIKNRFFMGYKRFV
jgi:hypothetical protein